MNLGIEDRDGTRIVRVAEVRIDAAVAIDFKEAVREAAGPDAARVILDLGAVTFLDSSGLGAVVAVMKLLGPGRTLELAALQPGVERVFRLTRMDTVFTIHASATRAVGQPRRLRDAG